jgi:DNA-binding MarR family transcriptional regulator
MVAGQLKRRGAHVATDSNASLENLENELVTLGRRLRGLQRTLSDEAHPDLEPAQYALLNHVEELAPVRMADLVAALEVDKGPVSRACARLEEQGLLRRAADKSDARATLLTLTPSGKRKLAAARKKRHKVIEDMLKDWSPAQVKTFASQVAKFNKVAG